MKFNTFGNKENPVMIMLAGSFCPVESMKDIYGILQNDFYIIAPTYNGHYENSPDFTTRRNEARLVADYLHTNSISSVAIIYGQSMGAEISIELLRQLKEKNISIDAVVLDGAPCIKLSAAYKAFMRFKFSAFIKMLKGKTVEQAMNIGLVKKFSNGSSEKLRPIIEPIIDIAPHISKRTLYNEVECCYTFDFPQFDNDTQRKMYFFYGSEEKAYKACFKHVKKAYPNANYRIEKDEGHLTYINGHLNDYISLIKSCFITTPSLQKIRKYKEKVQVNR